MRISVLTLGAIASILSINSVFATTSTVTSKDYVDAADALKQNKIPATGTNASTPGSTVVTYTSTAGTIGERGIYDGSTTYDADDDANKLVTAGVVSGFVGTKGPVTNKVCVSVVNNECILWDLVTREVFMNECYTNDQCPSGKYCISGICCRGCDCPGSEC